MDSYGDKEGTGEFLLRSGGMNLLDELRDIYKQEWWHETKLPDEEVDKYHKKLLDNGNIFCLCNKGLIAYIEYWKITQKQLDEILVDESWSGYTHDITHGDICYVANIWIREDYRMDKCMSRTLKNLFLSRNTDCNKFVWTRRKYERSHLFTHTRR